MTEGKTELAPLKKKSKIEKHSTDTIVAACFGFLVRLEHANVAPFVRARGHNPGHMRRLGNLPYGKQELRAFI